MNTRPEKLLSKLKKGEAYYAAGAADVFYLSGFSGTFGRVIISKNGCYFMTDRRYAAEVKKSGIEKAFNIVITKNLRNDVKKILSKTGAVLAGNSTPLGEFLMLKGFCLPKTSSCLSVLRMTKDPGEIRLIKKSVLICEAAFRHAAGILKEGMSEKDLALEFEYYARKNGATGVSFDVIAAFDGSSAVPHHKTSDARLKKGGLILLDAGVRYAGYCSDLTRCISFGIIRTRLKDIQKLYKIAQNAKAEAVKAFKNGCFIRTADRQARAYLKKHGGYDKLFTHSLGHGIGIDVHEPPYLNKKEKAVFGPGMVFTCEPGIYIEGRYGIRIEDDYLMTEKGPEKLGNLSDDLIISG